MLRQITRIQASLWITLMTSCICLIALAALLYWEVIYPGQGVPTAPLPSNSSQVEHNSDAAIQARWYTDKYIVDLPVADVRAFYEDDTQDCRRDNAAAPYIVVDNYALTCSGRARPVGSYEVQIGSVSPLEGSPTILVVTVRWGVIW